MRDTIPPFGRQACVHQIRQDAALVPTEPEHDLAAAAGVPVSRNRNQAFQRFALDYLRSGSVTMLIKYSGGQGFNAKTTAVLERWPLLASSGRLQVRQPVALDQPGGTR